MYKCYHYKSIIQLSPRFYQCLFPEETHVTKTTSVSILPMSQTNSLCTAKKNNKLINTCMLALGLLSVNRKIFT